MVYKIFMVPVNVRKINGIQGFLWIYYEIAPQLRLFMLFIRRKRSQTTR